VKRTRPYPTLAGALLAIPIVIAARHHFPRALTADDIAIAGTGLTLAATLLAYLAAGESRDAARESHQALRLHYKPGPAAIRFNYYDASVLGLPPKPSSSDPLWVNVNFRQPAEKEYSMEWTGLNGAVQKRRIASSLQRNDIWYCLDGINVEVDTGGPFRSLIGRLPCLRFVCRDSQTGTEWQATLKLPDQGQIGTESLVFFQPSI
jgi:hypothetical protein